MAAAELPSARVLLADGHLLFRDSLRTFLNVSGMAVTAVAARASETIERAAAARFSVAVLDLYLDRLGGVETTRRLAAQAPDLPILILATSRFDTELQEGIRRGASGYLFKGEEPEVVLRTILAAAQGTPILSPELARFLLRELEPHTDGGPTVARRAAGADLAMLTNEEWGLLLQIGASARPEVSGRALARTILGKLHRRYRTSGDEPGSR